MKALVIEDEIQLAEALCELLAREQYFVTSSHDGEDGLERALTGRFDVIVLDLMLPKLSGYQVLSELRNSGNGTPVLILSAKNELTDKLTGLDAGADDYLTKPFDGRELIARVRALTRRKGEYTGELLSYGDIALNCNTHELSSGHNAVILGSKEYQILEMLLSNPNGILPKERFIEKIWGYDTDAEYNNVEVYVSFLRKKLKAIGARTQIKSVRSVGYKPEYGDD